MPAPILIVEDSAPLRDALGDLLEHEGFETVRVENGLEALAYLRGSGDRPARDRPGLILLDMAMPEMDGAALILEVRKSTATAEIKIILMSAVKPASTIGADDFLEKPFGAEEALLLIRRHLGPAPAA